MDDQVIKLYEYDYDKPELSEETLEHHGILGMHWGTRNGPPYPLGSNISTGKRLKSGSTPSKHKQRKLKKKRVKSLKKARKVREQNRKVQQEQQKSKEEIMRTKDIASMAKNIDMFSNQDIQEMLTRLDWESKLRDRVRSQEEANKPFGKKAADNAWNAVKTGAGKGVTSTISTVSENAVKIGIERAVKSAGGTTEQAQDLIDKLFKEKKK